MIATATNYASLLTAYYPNGETDGELLRRFVAERDEHAFAGLVARHGSMVLGVCRRMLDDWHLAEDAFQATFLVLARKAATVSQPGAVGAWLHGVACWVSRGARRRHRLTSERESTGIDLPDRPAEPTSEFDVDIGAVLDDELRKLPSKYRAILVACDLEGLPRRPVAESFGIPEGTLSSRLAAARKMLAARLTRRGVAGAVTGVLTTSGLRVSAGDVDRALMRTAIRFGSIIPGKVPDSVLALVNGVTHTMAVRTFALISLGLLPVVAIIALAAPPDAPPLPVIPARAGHFLSVVAPGPKVEAQPKTAGPNKLLYSRAGELVLIDPDGKNEKKLPTIELLNPIANNSRLSRDGKQLAVLTGVVGPRPYMTLGVRGTAEKDPVKELGVECTVFAWSPDGTEIVCSNVDEEKNVTVATHFIVNLKTKVTKPLDLPKNHVVTDWSRDGKFFLTTLINPIRDPASEIHMWSLDGKEHTSLAGTKDEGAAFGQFSPDGSRVLYDSYPLGEGRKGYDPKESRLSVLDRATGKATPVAGPPTGGEIQSYCWSPDGKRIAYSWREIRADKNVFSHIVVCDPDGKNAKTIATQKGPEPTANVPVEISWR